MREYSFGKSDLTIQQQAMVFAAEVSENLCQQAGELLHECTKALSLPKPSALDIEMAARIIGAFGSDELPQTVEGNKSVHPTWLLTETWILLNKDPLPIHQAVLKLILTANESVVRG